MRQRACVNANAGYSAKPGGTQDREIQESYE